MLRLLPAVLLIVATLAGAAPARTQEASAAANPAPVAIPAPLQTPLPARRLRSPEASDPLTPDTLRRLPIQATPRLGRGMDDAAPACRKECAPRYFACLAADEQSSCAASWSACLSSCSTLVTSR
jgi:hypothetical protein